MVEASTSLRILFLVPEIIDIPKLIARMKTPLTDNYEFVQPWSSMKLLRTSTAMMSALSALSARELTWQ